MRNRWFSFLGAVITRADAAAWAIIDMLPGYPVATAAVLSAVTGRSKPVIAMAVSQLHEAGILVSLSQGARNRAWEAAGLLDAAK